MVEIVDNDTEVVGKKDKDNDKDDKEERCHQQLDLVCFDPSFLCLRLQKHYPQSSIRCLFLDPIFPLDTQQTEMNKKK